MTKRENYISIAKRKGLDRVPVEIRMCPATSEKYEDYLKHNLIDFDIEPSAKAVGGFSPLPFDMNVYNKYYEGLDLKQGTRIDNIGVAHEPGSDATFHMTKMYHPMRNFDSVEQILAYPFLDYSNINLDYHIKYTEDIHKENLFAMGYMQCTIWETSWYLRGMENLMMDMMSDDPMAEVLLDKITDNAVMNAQAFAKSGVDGIFLGDDIGMQRTIMMSDQLYCEWLKPRLAKVIGAAKEIKPDILIYYHTCGFVTPFISHLIEAGVDILDPIQPECMDFNEIHYEFGDRISFHGTIGTQKTMPFGTPDDVRKEVFKNLDIAGEKGGLYVAPTHLLEPEVPIENVFAYLKACNDYTK